MIISLNLLKFMLLDFGCAAGRAVPMQILSNNSFPF